MNRFAAMRRKADASPPATQAMDDAVVRDRINRSMRRRMSDELVGLIRRACLCGHAETAKGLWLVLRDLTQREAQQRFPNGRLPEKGLLEALAIEIAAAAGEPPPQP